MKTNIVVARHARQSGADNILLYGWLEQARFRIAFRNLGYEPIELFASDFAIAEYESNDCVLETINRHANNYLHDVKRFTELVMCMLYKSLTCKDRGWEELHKLYDRLFSGILSMGESQFTGADWKYFSRTIKKTIHIEVKKNYCDIFNDAPVIFC